MRRGFACVVAVTIAAVSVCAGSQSDKLILSCGTFSPNATLASLQKTFGAREVGRDSVPLGPSEGDMLGASVLFPNDPARRIKVVWNDSANAARPKYVYLRGAVDWRTPEGISIGSSLKDVERINGVPFRIAGFGFDGSGYVNSWNGGRIKSSSSQCQLRVWVDSIGTLNESQQKLYRQVAGGRLFSSGHPAMQAINPKVSQIILEFP